MQENLNSTSQQKNESLEFKPIGALASFLLLLVAYVGLWLIIYFIMIARNLH